MRFPSGTSPALRKTIAYIGAIRERERGDGGGNKENQGITLVYTDVNSHYQVGTVSAAQAILEHFGKLIPVIALIILWYLRYRLINI